MAKCEFCDVKFATWTTLRSHHRRFDGKCAIKRTFDNWAAFTEWREQVECTTNSTFSIVYSRKGYVLFKCFRSGHYKAKKQGQTSMRSTCKMGKDCTAYISVKKSSDEEPVTVSYCLHHNHDNDIQCARLSARHRAFIRERLAKGLSSTQILAEARSSSLTKLRVLKRKDVNNISRTLKHLTRGDVEQDSSKSPEKEFNLPADTTLPNSDATNEQTTLVSSLTDDTAPSLGCGVDFSQNNATTAISVRHLQRSDDNCADDERLSFNLQLPLNLFWLSESEIVRQTNGAQNRRETHCPSSQQLDIKLLTVLASVATKISQMSLENKLSALAKLETMEADFGGRVGRHVAPVHSSDAAVPNCVDAEPDVAAKTHQPAATQPVRVVRSNVLRVRRCCSQPPLVDSVGSQSCVHTVEHCSSGSVHTATRRRCSGPRARVLSQQKCTGAEPVVEQRTPVLQDSHSTSCDDQCIASGVAGRSCCHKLFDSTNHSGSALLSLPSHPVQLGVVDHSYCRFSTAAGRQDA